MVGKTWFDFVVGDHNPVPIDLLELPPQPDVRNPRHFTPVHVAREMDYQVVHVVETRCSEQKSGSINTLTEHLEH